MAIKNFSFTVDTININNNIVANVKQLDNAIFNITITENSQLKDLSGQNLKLFVKKSDGSILVQTDNITISDATNGKVSININNSIFALGGVVVAEIDISGSDGDISTATFCFNVYEKIGDNEAIKANVDIDLFKQIANLMDTATKEIEQYKTYYDAFTTAGVSLEGLNDIKSYIDNNLANLKSESDNANTLNTALKATIQDSTTAKTALDSTIANSSTAKEDLQKIIDNANSQGYLTTDQLNTTLKTFVPFLIWQGKSTNDCNTLTTNGFYSINAMEADLSTTHYPLNGEWALLFTWSTEGATDGGTVIQIFYSLNTKRLFYRMFNDSGWRDWAEVVTTDTLNNSLADIKTLIDTKIKAIDPANFNIIQNSNGITLSDNNNLRTFNTERTVNSVKGSTSLGVESFNNFPVTSLRYLQNNVLQSTFQMLVNGEFKLKDDAATGTTALLFCSADGTTDKGYIGKYNGGQFTVKSNTDDLIFGNGYTSNVAVGKGGYFYPLSDGDWALGKSNYRWSNLYTKSVTNTSDERLKENIEYIDTVATNTENKNITIDDLYDFVKDNLKLATYDFINNKNEDTANKGKLGFIAQDFLNNPVGESILLPKENENDFLSYDLNNYINLLAGALQKAITNIENIKQINQVSILASVKIDVLNQQITQLLINNMQLTQRVSALETK